MADTKPQLPAMLVVAAFSRHPSALAWARKQLENCFGPVDLASVPFSFTQTAYYERTMGLGLAKQFLCFRDLVEPDRLADFKQRTNELEKALASSGDYSERRPLNLDPGLLTLGKFMLATTKDQGHRLYLRDGIFAEVTLHYQYGVWEPWPWTYADYREDGVREFLREARELYRLKLGARNQDD